MFIFLYIIQLTSWLFIVRFFFRNTAQRSEKVVFILGLTLKVLVGCGVGLLYMHYYHGGDTFVYFKDAVTLSNLFIDNPIRYIKVILGLEEFSNLQYVLQERALFFVYIASLVSIISLQNYWLMAMFFSLFNFLSAWWFIFTLKKYVHLPFNLLFIPFIFYPSVFFWTSGLLKESLALAMIYLLCGIFIQVYYHLKFTCKIHLSILLSFPIAWILWMLKYYYAAILLPILLVLIIYALLKEFTGIFSDLRKMWIILLFGLSILFLIFMHLHPNLHPDSILTALVRNHDLSVAASEEGDYIFFKSLEPTFLSFVIHFPLAVVSGFFRPILGEGNSILHILAGIENLMIFGISSFALSLIIIKKVKMYFTPLSLACLFYVMILAGCIALASPNFGSLVRYKVAYAPFWLFLCLCVIHASQWRFNPFQSIKKI